MANIGDLIKKQKKTEEKNREAFNSSYADRGDATHSPVYTEPDKFTRETDRWVSDDGGRKSTARSIVDIQTDLNILNSREKALQREQSILLAPDSLSDNTPRLNEILKEIEDITQKRKTLETEKFVEETYANPGKRDSFSGQFDANMELGRLVQDQGRAWNDYLEKPTEENRKRAEMADKAVIAYQTRNRQALDDKDTVAPLLSKDLANYIPQLVDQTKSQAAGAIAGGLIGGIATGGTGVLQGIKVGSALASGKQMFEVTRGAAFKRLLDLGVDEALARDLAQDEGIVNGIIESGDTYLEWLTLGGTKAVTGVASKIAPDLLKKASTKAGKSALKKLTDKVPALVKALAGYLGNIPQEGLEEGWQEGVSLANDARALEGKDTGILGLAAGSAKAALDPENREQVWEAAKGGMKIAAMVGGAQVVTNQLLGAKDKKQSEPTTKQAPVDKTVKAADNKATEVSPAAAPEVQQTAQQAVQTKAANPKAEVLNAAETLFVEHGMSLKTAKKRADIVSRLVAGEKVDDDEIRSLEPTNPKTQADFTTLTGVQFPEGVNKSIEKLRATYRSAHEVAVQAQRQAEITEQAAQIQVQAETEIAQEMAQEAPVMEQAQEVGPDGEPLLDLDAFAEVYRARVNPNAGNTEIQTHYVNYRNGARQSLTLESGAEVTREQFVAEMREYYQSKGKDYSPGVLDTMFNQVLTLADQGQLGAYAADLEQIAQKYKEGNVNGRENLSDDGSGRVHGQSTREQAGRVEGVERQAESRPGSRERAGVHEGTDSRGAGGDRGRVGQAVGADGRQEQQVTQKEASTTLRARKPQTRKVDVGDGTQVRVLVKRELTESHKRVKAKFARLKRSVNFVMGRIPTGVEGEYASGVHDSGPNGLNLVRADDDYFTAEQLGDHEFLHLGMELDPEMRGSLLLEFRKLPAKQQAFLVNKYKNRIKGVYGVTGDQLTQMALDEILCDAYGNMNRCGWGATELHESVASVVDEWLDNWDARSQELARQEERLSRQQDIVDKQNSTSVRGRVYSLTHPTVKRPWAEQIDNRDSADIDDLYIPNTPQILGEVGLGDLPLCLSKRHLADIMHEKDPNNVRWHGITEEQVKKIPYLLSKPAMIMNSHSTKGDIVVVTTERDSDGLPIVICIRPNGEALVDGVRGPANFITSMYGRYNFAPIEGVVGSGKNNLLAITIHDRGILYWNKERTEALAKHSGLHLPVTLQRLPSDTILKDHEGYVKGSIPERVFSPEDTDDWDDFGDLAEDEKNEIQAEIDEVFGKAESEQPAKEYTDAETGELYGTWSGFEEAAYKAAEEKGYGPGYVYFQEDSKQAKAYVIGEDGFSTIPILTVDVHDDSIQNQSKPEFQYISDFGELYTDYLDVVKSAYDMAEAMGYTALDVEWSNNHNTAHLNKGGGEMVHLLTIKPYHPAATDNFDPETDTFDSWEHAVQVVHDAYWPIALVPQGANTWGGPDFYRVYLLDSEDGAQIMSLGFYHSSSNGLRQFNDDLTSLLDRAGEAMTEWVENTDPDNILKDSFSPASWERDSLQTDRYDFTPIDTPAFKNYFNDDSGELTLANGLPVVLVRGTPFAGPTSDRVSSDSYSGGIFTSNDISIAAAYADGATAKNAENTWADAMKLNPKKYTGAREIPVGYKRTWKEAQDYIFDYFRSYDGAGMRLVPVKDGVPTNRMSATAFELQTNVLPQSEREGLVDGEYVDENGQNNDWDHGDTPYDNLRVTGDTWRTLEVFENSEEGLDKLNADLGNYVRAWDLGLRGYTKVYGTADKTLVIDAKRRQYSVIPNNTLPRSVWSPKSPTLDGTSHINGIARRAWAAGYDCVIVKNVSDIGGIQTQYIFRDPGQLKSVYNKGTWDRGVNNRNFSLEDSDQDIGQLDGNYKSWNSAFLDVSDYGENLAFAQLPFPGEDIQIGALGIDGKWINAIKTYTNDADGLAQFNADLPTLFAQAEKMATGDMGDDMAHMDSYEVMYDDELNGKDSVSAKRAAAEAKAIQDDRAGMTNTNTKAFRNWFHDDSGMLTDEDGTPKIFLRGSENLGKTKGRSAKSTYSGATFFTEFLTVAKLYADGTATAKRGYTLGDVIQLNDKEGRDKLGEWKPKYHKSWKSAIDYINEYFSSDDGDGLRLVPVKSDGTRTNRRSADGYMLQTNILDRSEMEGLNEHGKFDDPDDSVALSYDWSDLAYYPKDALEQLNQEFGDHLETLELGIQGFGKFYLSADKTLVVDVDGHSHDSIPNYMLDDEIQAGHENGLNTTNSIVRRAFDAGYDCVVIQNVMDIGSRQPQTQYAIKNPEQMKSVYNRGTWDKKNSNFLYSMTDGEVDNFNALFDRLEQDFGAGSSDQLISAFEALGRSRQMAREAARSVGAAPTGFDPYSHLQNEYGTQEPGEKPARVVDVPTQTEDWNKVSRTPVTVMEAKATPDSRIPAIEEAVVDGKFSYIEGHNKIQVRRANAYIQKKGWAEAVAEWQKDVREGKVNADLAARGAVILNNAGSSDMDGKRYVSLLTDYYDLLHRAGQATQAARILKNLSPTGRLYQIQAYTDRVNERVRPDNSAHNIPVEKWMQITGELLADRLKSAVGGSRKKALTTAQTILDDLNRFARESFPEKEKTPGRTELDRIKDLFDNYENYHEAWEAAKATIREQYADDPAALAAFENFLETDLAEAFLSRYFNHPEVRINPDLTQKFLTAKTDEERDTVVDEIIKDIARQIPATKMDKFTALRYLNMLGNVKTQVRNILGNTTNLGLTKAKNQVANLLELGAHVMGVKVERTKSFTKDKETYRAALADFEQMQEVVLSGGKYEDGKKFDQRIEDQRRIFNSRVLEGYRKATNWAMTQGDLVFSKIAYADALAGYLQAHNVTFETATPAMLDAARNYAVQQAAEATFRDSNAFSEAISGMRFKNPDTWAKKGLNLLGEGLLPFRKTPANILVRAVEYSPVGVLTTAAEAVYGKRKTGVVDGSKVIDSLAKNLTGTGILVLGFALANAGLLRGKGADEEKEKDFDELTGHQSYSIELPNGLSLTLDWLAPSSIPLFLGAQMADIAAEEGLTLRTGLEALGAITDPMLSMSMLQGLDDALSNASTYGGDSALVRFTGNALWSFSTQGLTNTMLGQLERSLKNERSTTYRDKNKDLPDGIQYLLGKTLEKTPFVDYGQIPYIDAWGRTEQNARTAVGNVVNQFLNPSYTSLVEESDMEEELRRLADVTGEQSVLISRPNSYFNVDGERKDLTAEEFVTYATTRGRTAYNVATDLTESRMYAGLTDKQKVKAVEKAYDFANQLAKAEATGYDASKWGTEPPDGACVPDKWVITAAQNAAEYGIPVSDYVTAYAAVSDLESFKDANGETVDNSKSLRVAAAIYDLGLSEAQTKKLMEDLGVNKTVRGYQENMVRNKLKQMEKKYG